MTQRIRHGCFGVLLLATSLLFPAASSAQARDTTDDDELRQIEIDRTPWVGDFDGMFDRRHIRMLVPYSRTLFFVDKGRERGITAEIARGFERYLNQKYKKKLAGRPLTLSLIATTRDRLVGDLARGLGDIAAGNLTVTPERLRAADFVVPAEQPPVLEELVCSSDAPPVANLDSLSGKTVEVRRSSSYYESLIALNARFKADRRAAVQILLLPDALEDEDVLEMVNAGLIGLTIVDSWKARIWAQALPRIKIRKDIVLRDDGKTGWAIRRDSPRLRNEIEAFDRGLLQHQDIIESRIASYERNVRQISNSTGGAAWKRFEKTLALFKKYGTKYDFDPLMLVAQGYQESKLDQTARSHMGAIGVMQIMPATGAELRVGDIEQLEPNIHAGAKYMDRLMSKYFAGAQFDEANRTLFAFASYNAGPGNISRMRSLAEKRGLDPNEWFNDVELVVAQKIGMETTTYVRNIYKYYVAYKLTLEAQQTRAKARQSIESNRN